jgi:hypothetical protein
MSKRVKVIEEVAEVKPKEYTHIKVSIGLHGEIVEGVDKMNALDETVHTWTIQTFSDVCMREGMKAVLAEVVDKKERS